MVGGTPRRSGPTVSAYGVTLKVGATGRSPLQGFWIPGQAHSTSKLLAMLGTRKRPLGISPTAFLDMSSPGRTRTSDQLVNSQPLYLLSYRGIVSLVLYWRLVIRPEQKWSSSTRATGRCHSEN